MINMTDICKSFSGNAVLKNVHFSLHQGEIHALMGENGAGKSTLMKIMSGIYTRDSGTVEVKGKKVEFTSPKQAEAEGIAVIHQELNILPHLSIADNLFLGREETVGRTGILKTKDMERKTKKILGDLGLDIDPSLSASTLSVGQQQLVEIGKALSMDAEMIIMDEPTAALTDREIETLFVTIRDLQKRGVSFVYISHRMEEIFSLCDRITILRDGEFVGERKISETSFEEIVQLMVGRELGDRFPERSSTIGDVKLSVKGLSRKDCFEDISFDIHKGEIVSIAGLMGAGRTEVAQSLFGYKKADTGTVELDGKPAKIDNPQKAKELGIGYVTEDRKSEGLIVDFTVEENISMANFESISKKGLLSKDKERSLYDRMVKRLGIRTSGPDQAAKSLSGGNQQKVVIAKWLGIEPDVLILDEPTRGVDVGAKKEIYSIINELAARGVAILMISSELPEVIGMADRVLVMHEGKLTADLPKQKMTQETIMHYATGGGKLEAEVR
ncbi:MULTISPECIES: sugar ABC transporter ATP-binding protein [unclassified Planococcus (in: firmicutes)]|uniref:sugar ABC transporter ATP-binding protein n=1 Tax=unclassified Planococcus (in: firmicutes) TaxID=2662419 RepID=UPI000C348567|nr:MULTISPECIES: sugar ABC transporter ATP-binding protein [unclassified Planococcus (in: firmicutes)]AUD15366.1 D-xylose ABC transporter ATP-binding protein [Planococcus sp. MB-3u-03]PKG45276.1 D-xylose ABC transporter ATP-binding protein [Planococcus sp. Urea-trap-24]PKG87904.1 D-xylose ABC transporter ATP-binding protein [Planococcus sp. Urea-3u-39]PKH42655.1 D-xylose ABC transporter ATP-binding protein [Planococcus sp. MB-3u-09]